MKSGTWSFALVMFLLAGAVYSANGAALQVTGHSTVPDTIYPGTTGQLQVTLLNSGTDSADQVTIDYSTPSQSQNYKVSVGDIGIGSASVASIPFTVPLNTASGFFVINMNIVYFGDNTHTTIKNSPVSIPVVISQHQILAVKTLSVQPQAVQPGDKLTSQLEIVNTGGVMNNAVISTPDNSSFSIEGVSQQTIGSIPFNSSKVVSIVLRLSSSTPPGRYSVPLIVSYQDSLQNTINQTVSIGPVTVTESSAQFRIYLIPITITEAGSESKFDLTLDNLAGSSTSAIVDVNQTAEFTPIGTARLYFDDIEPGTNQTKTITIGVGATTLAGYYNLPLAITSNGKTYTQNVGIVVDAIPGITISSDTQPQFVSSGSSGVKILAQVANTGNGPIRSVYVSTKSTKDLRVIGTTDKFIGTLNVDDFATFQINVNVPPNTVAGDYQMPITLTFKDSKNEEHTVNRDVTVTVYSAQDAAGFGAAGSADSTAARARNGGLFGLGPIPTIAIAIIIIVAGYFGYKKWKAGKNKVAK
jgi:uncharacterized membrane protein